MTSLSARGGENRREKYEQQTRAHYHRRRRSLYIYIYTETTTHAYTHTHTHTYMSMYVCYTGQRRKMRKRWKRRRRKSISAVCLTYCVHTVRTSRFWSAALHTHIHTLLLLLLLLFTRVHSFRGEFGGTVFETVYILYMCGLDPYPVTYTDILMYIILNVHIISDG